MNFSLLAITIPLALSFGLAARPLFSFEGPGKFDTFAEKAAAMKMLSEHLRANYSRVRTWQGEFHISSEVVIRGEYAATIKSRQRKGRTNGDVEPPFVQRTTTTFRFLVDVRRDTLFSVMDSECPVFFSQKTGEKLVFGTLGEMRRPGQIPSPFPVFGRNYSKVIVTPEHLLSVNPEQFAGQLPNRHFGYLPAGGAPIIYRDARQIIPGPAWSRDVSFAGGKSFDPRTLFGVSMPFWDQLEGLAQLPQRARPEQQPLINDSVSIRADESTKGKYIVSFRTNGSLTETTYDPAQGFNAVHFIRKNEAKGQYRVAQELTWEYKRHEDCYLPSVFKFLQFDRDAQISISITQSMTRCELNRDLPPGAFTVAQFKLPNGTRMLDRIADKLLIVSGNDLIPASEYQPKRERSAFTFVAIIVSCLRVVGVIL